VQPDLPTKSAWNTGEVRRTGGSICCPTAWQTRKFSSCIRNEEKSKPFFPIYLSSFWNFQFTRSLSDMISRIIRVVTILLEKKAKSEMGTQPDPETVNTIIPNIIICVD